MQPRLKAFLLHLMISALIALVVMCLVFFIWYPSPLHAATGVTGIFLMLLAIDVILGPALTLLVFKPGKKTLVLDLVVIACLQLCALFYGVYSVAEGRPAWLVFAQDRFELVRNNDLDLRQLNEALPEYRRPSWFGPGWTIALLPEAAASQNDLLFESVLGGFDLAQRPNLYRPIEQHRHSVWLRIRALSLLNDFNPDRRVRDVLRRHPDADGWLPLAAVGRDMVVLLNRESVNVVAIVDLRPWN